jgi:hypothetical protein
MGLPVSEVRRRVTLRELVERIGFELYEAALQSQAVERLKQERDAGRD